MYIQTRKCEVFFIVERHFIDLQLERDSYTFAVILISDFAIRPQNWGKIIRTLMI